MPDQRPTEDTDPATREPIDPDIDLRQAGQGRRGRDDASVLAVIAAGSG